MPLFVRHRRRHWLAWRVLKFLILLVSILLANEGLSWRRRRRRRAPPPPPVHCVMSAWSSWGVCDNKCGIGSHSRYRTVITYPSYGGTDCSTVLSQTENCGAINGGCGVFCRSSDGACSCTVGYVLQADKKSCGDKNECSDGTAVCVNSNCVNTIGSYDCQCLDGYEPSSIKTKCSPKSCPPLTTPQCPDGAYNDVFGASCVPVVINYPYGYEYLESSTLTCPLNYKLAIVPQPSSGKQFAEDFSTVDFTTPNYQSTCTWDSGAGSVTWDWNPQQDPYYCRRLNDPPVNITLSNSLINEKEPFLTLVGTLTAKDGQKDTLSFTIQNTEGINHFLIQGNKLQVKTLLVWNHLGTNARVVIVNATDNGSPPMYSQTSLNITILNINDPPHDIELSNNEVFENVPTGHILGNLTAIDDDIGPQRISNFSWHLVDSDNGFFSLNGSQVVVAKILDHEEKIVHRIKVQCSDFGEPRQFSTIASILVNVRDANDSPKSVNLTKDNVLENSPRGTLVGYVEAADDDNDTLSFYLNGTDLQTLKKFKLKGPTNCIFKPSANGGKAQQKCSVALVVDGSLDYEQEDEYTVWLAVADPGGITRTKLKIRIDDVNERPTGIIMTNNHVPENSHGGTVVGEFLVSDPDNKNGLRQSHTCSLLNSLTGDEDAFVITHTNNRNILRVKPNKLLNFEIKKFYNITVTCTDRQKLGLTKSFIILITDVNEEPTSLSLCNARVKENSPDFTFIGNLSAQDPEGDNGTFLYSVTSSTSGNFFVGGRNHNQLLVNGSIDFEKTAAIDVHMRVTDSGGLYLEKIFTITVEDVNDAPTDIILQANSKLPENSGKRVFIGGVSVIDQDGNSKASCQLLNSSNDRVLLEGLNLLVGATNTDYESLDSSKSLEILLTCSDEHGASLTRWLTVPVEDVNERPTKLTLNNLQVRENSNGTLVGILEITDPDINQRHNCIILESANQTKSLFYIDKSTNPPILKTAQPLDFETSKQHAVDIKCLEIVNSNQISHAKEQLFVISVIDVNEPPVIWCNESFYVSSSSSNGFVIGKIQGYDPDNELYYRSKRSNPDRPHRRKQFLTYRFEPENNSWPFDITLNGIVELRKRLNEHDYNGSITLGVRVEDDGRLLERLNGSDKYQIKKGERKYSVKHCQVIIISNISDKDIHLSSNYIHENATEGTIIGNLSRNSNNTEERITFHIINNDEVPFAIDGNTLYLSELHNDSLDYEKLPHPKTLPVTISSRSTLSGIFTKKFFIQIIDVNEQPTAICLLRPRPHHDCTVVGHIFIEDLDHPELHCGSIQTINVTDISNKLSAEYSCRINGTEVPNFSITSSLTLHGNKVIFTQSDRSNKVPIVCRSDRHPLHNISAVLNVTITHPIRSDCRCDFFCSQPTFCLKQSSLAGTCVAKENRINSTVAIQGTYFQQQNFIDTFQEYVENLIEGRSDGKTLKNLVNEFDDQQSSRRRRREVLPRYENVYVELLVHSGAAEATTVVFAAAKDSKLILASSICQLLKDSEVKCYVDNSTPNRSKGDKEDKTGFPIWVYVIIGVGALLVFILLVVVMRRRRRSNKKNDTNAIVRFEGNGDSVNIDSVYETPVDTPNQVNLNSTFRPKLPNQNSDPVLVEKRKDIKVFNNPVYRTPRNPMDDTDSDEDNEAKKRTFNHYEQTDPEPMYQTIDDDLYEKVNEEATKSKGKKSRSNPVYNMDEDDDNTLNPVLNLAAHPVKIAKRSEKSRGDARDNARDEKSDDSWTAEIMSTLKTNEGQKKSHGDLGIVNPTYTVNVEVDKHIQKSTPPGSPKRADNKMFQFHEANSKNTEAPQRNEAEGQSSC